MVTRAGKQWGQGRRFQRGSICRLQADSAIEPMLCQDEFLQAAAEILQRSKPIDFALGSSQVIRNVASFQKSANFLNFLAFREADSWSALLYVAIP